MIKYTLIDSSGKCVEFEAHDEDFGQTIKANVGTPQCQWFDAVTTKTGDGCVLVGYVNDEGHLFGLPINPTATAVFGRILCGNVLVLGGTNPKTGEYDGDNHEMTNYQKMFIKHTASVLNIRPVVEEVPA